MLNQFKLIAKPELALVSAKLVKNLWVKWAKFLYTNNTKLYLKIYNKYKSVIVDKKIGISKKKNCIKRNII